MAITSVTSVESRMLAVLYCDLLTYAVIVLNGDSKAHLEVVTGHQPLDQAQLLS